MAGNAIKNDFIYIVLVKAHTGLGKVSRVLSGGYEYSHIAVCKDDRFEDFITFSRRRHYAPFDAGFMHETRGCYCFGTHDRVKLKVFRLPIDLRAKRKVYHFLRHVERQQDNYLFNLYSMVTMPVLHGFMIDDAYNCMSFVGKVVELSRICSRNGIFLTEVTAIQFPEGVLLAGFHRRRRDIWTGFHCGRISGCFCVSTRSY